MRGQCGICGRVFPVNLLIAAHISSEPLLEVREDRLQKKCDANVRLGCDDLYERGISMAR